MKVTNKRSYEIKQDKYKEKHSQVYHNVVVKPKIKKKSLKNGEEQLGVRHIFKGTTVDYQLASQQ